MRSRIAASKSLPNRVLRECVGQLVALVARLFMRCKRGGDMIRSWKLVNVPPVYKKKSKSDPANLAMFFRGRVSLLFV